VTLPLEQARDTPLAVLLLLVDTMTCSRNRKQQQQWWWAAAGEHITLQAYMIPVTVLAN
jgi:hypothetical protein